MKKILFRTLIFPLILLASLPVFSQESDKPGSGSIITGSGRRYIINVLEQDPIRAKILSMDDDWIYIKKSDGTIQNLNRDAVISIEEIPFGTVGSIGAGFGVPYGYLGINLEINILPVLSLSGGLGTTVSAGVGWSVGARGYFIKPGHLWRPRLSAFYGTNALYNEDSSDSGNKSYSGATIGVGQIVMWGRHGFDLDLMYAVYSQIDDVYPEDYSKIKISLGYRFAF